MFKAVKDNNNNKKKLTKTKKRGRFIEAHVLLYMSSSLVFQSKELQTEPPLSSWTV
ncbi:MAG TPA: hypothetical protein VJ583_04610 [Nitrososphaeraceae archaeon]|nr:hypothetical protein [Nitrososphaeraceae archaeon]